MPLDVASKFSVNWAYNTVSGWQTPHIHVVGERTSPPCTAWCHLLNGWMCGHQRPFSGVRGNRGSVSPVWEALTLSKHWKNQDCSDPNWAKRSWSQVLTLLPPGWRGAQREHAAAGWSDLAHGMLLLHQPQASLCFTCQSLLGDLTWFTHEQNSTKTK